MRHITVLLVDDQQVIRESLRSRLNAEADLALVGEAKDGLQAVTMAAKFCPDVIIMDISMPRLNGLEAMERILKMRPATRVLILSAHIDDTYIAHARTLGAAGCLSKQTDINQLPNAIRQAHLGGPFVGPHMPRRPDLPPKKATARETDPA